MYQVNKCNKGKLVLNFQTHNDGLCYRKILQFIHTECKVSKSSVTNPYLTLNTPDDLCDITGLCVNATHSRWMECYTDVSVEWKCMVPAVASPLHILSPIKTHSAIISWLWSHSEGHFEAGSVGMEPSEDPSALAAASVGRNNNTVRSKRGWRSVAASFSNWATVFRNIISNVDNRVGVPVDLNN